MAKSNSDSNGLRQDQPEWVPDSRPGSGGDTLSTCAHALNVHMSGPSVGDTARPRRSGITELSRLTSDPICTADRRGGILMVVDPIIDELTSSRVGHRVAPRAPSCGCYHSGLPHLTVAKCKSVYHGSIRQSEYGKRHHTAFKYRSDPSDSTSSPRCRRRADHGLAPLSPAPSVPACTRFPILSISKTGRRCE